MLKKSPGKWSHLYDSCVGCQSTVREHGAKGYCWRCYNRICMKEPRKAYRKLHPSNDRTCTGFKYKNALYPKTKHCEICDKECNTALDHDHKTMRFRGWLCMQCNTALGSVRDNIEILQKMIGYIVKNS